MDNRCKRIEKRGENMFHKERVIHLRDSLLSLVANSEATYGEAIDGLELALMILRTKGNDFLNGVNIREIASFENESHEKEGLPMPHGAPYCTP